MIKPTLIFVLNLHSFSVLLIFHLKLFILLHFWTVMMKDSHLATEVSYAQPFPWVVALDIFRVLLKFSFLHNLLFFAEFFIPPFLFRITDSTNFHNLFFWSIYFILSTLDSVFNGNGTFSSFLRIMHTALRMWNIKHSPEMNCSSR